MNQEGKVFIFFFICIWSLQFIIQSQDTESPLVNTTISPNKSNSTTVEPLLFSNDLKDLAYQPSEAFTHEEFTTGEWQFPELSRFNTQPQEITTEFPLFEFFESSQNAELSTQMQYPGLEFLLSASDKPDQEISTGFEKEFIMMTEFTEEVSSESPYLNIFDAFLAESYSKANELSFTTPIPFEFQHSEEFSSISSLSSTALSTELTTEETTELPVKSTSEVTPETTIESTEESTSVAATLEKSTPGITMELTSESSEKPTIPSTLSTEAFSIMESSPARTIPSSCKQNGYVCAEKAECYVGQVSYCKCRIGYVGDGERNCIRYQGQKHMVFNVNTKFKSLPYLKEFDDKNSMEFRYWKTVLVVHVLEPAFTQSLKGYVKNTTQVIDIVYVDVNSLVT